MKSYGTLWCYHSNESYSAVLSCGAVYYVVQGGSNFGFTIQMKAAEQYFPLVVFSRAVQDGFHFQIKRDMVALYYLVTFSRLMEHFQIAPVAAASNSLFSTLNERDTKGSRPPYFRTRSRVSLSSAH